MSALKMCPHSSSTNFVVSTEPLESAVERQGMSLAVEAQAAQEQHHSSAGLRAQLLPGLQPLLLAIGESPFPVEGLRINAQRDQRQLGTLGGDRVCWKRSSRRSCMQAIAACTTFRADQEVQTRASQGSSGPVTSCSRLCITRWEQRVWVTPVSEKRLEAVGPKPAPMVQPRIGQVQASAPGDQCWIEIRMQFHLGPGVSTGCSRVCSAGKAARLPVNMLSWSPGLSEAARPLAKLLPATRRPIT